MFDSPVSAFGDIEKNYAAALRAGKIDTITGIFHFATYAVAIRAGEFRIIRKLTWTRTIVRVYAGGTKPLRPRPGNSSYKFDSMDFYAFEKGQLDDYNQHMQALDERFPKKSNSVGIMKPPEITAGGH